MSETGSQRFSQRLEAAPARVVVGGATATGAIVGGLTTALPVAVLYLWKEMSPYCAPWEASARVSMVLQVAIPGVVVGAPWGALAGVMTRWMANRAGGKVGLGCLIGLLVISLLIAVAVALVWFMFAAWGMCQ